MKKIFFSLLILFAVALTSSASELLNIPYKNIKEEDKIKLNNDVWTNKISRRDSDYFVKIVSDGTGSYSEFYNSDGTFAFTTGCQYEFLYKGDLIGYSNQDLKFYDFTYADGLLNRRELSVDEIASMFPDFKIIKISEFSTNTNSLKVKKEGHNFKIILGSATPSLETKSRALKGIYEQLYLKKRINNLPLPKVDIVDLTNKNNISSESALLSNSLIEAIKNRLTNHQQSILLVNRRGHSPYVSCRECGYVIKCPNCQVALTYHYMNNKLICHHCNYEVDMITKCPKCNSNKVFKGGFGTEKIELEIKKIFPEARVLRLDSDITRKVNLTNKIIQEYCDSLLQNKVSTTVIHEMVLLIKLSLKRDAKINSYHPLFIDLDLPATSKKKKVTILSRTDQKSIMNYILSNDNQKYCGIILSLMTGLRIGELCALKWSDIDLKKRIIVVNKTLQRICEKGKKSKITITTPKTSNSLREIPMSNTLYDFLIKLKPAKRDIYFLTSTSVPTEPRNYRKIYLTLLKKLKINKTSFHALRHTFATRLIENKVDIKTVSELLGHASVNITISIYVHSEFNTKRKAVKTLDNLILK